MYVIIDTSVGNWKSIRMSWITRKWKYQSYSRKQSDVGTSIQAWWFATHYKVHKEIAIRTLCLSMSYAV